MAENEIVFKETHDHPHGILETTALHWRDQGLVIINTRVKYKYIEGWCNFPTTHIAASALSAKDIAKLRHSEQITKIDLLLLHAADGRYNYEPRP